MFTTRSPINIIAASGLALGAVFGMAGNVVAQLNLRAVFWAIDGAGLVLAAVVLAVKYLRVGQDLLAAGFMIFAIAEAAMLSGMAAPAPAASFAAGTALWAVALPLISIPRVFAMPVRMVGLVSAALFGITAAKIFWGEDLLPTSAPLPSYAYPFLVLTFIGWIWTLLREAK
jgi:hypothetical protein